MAMPNFKSKARLGRNFCRNSSEGGLPLSDSLQEGAELAPSSCHDMRIIHITKDELLELDRVEIFLRCMEIDLGSHAKRTDGRCDLAGWAEVVRFVADLIAAIRGRLDTVHLPPLPARRSSLGETSHD